MPFALLYAEFKIIGGKPVKTGAAIQDLFEEKKQRGDTQQMANHLMSEITILRNQIKLQKEEIRELKRQALQDPLTGLANRRSFEIELKKALSYYKRYMRSGSVLMIDVDAFKSINDSLGHLAGDAILKHISQILLNHTRDTDTVARIGGDEFCIILRELTSWDARTKAKHLAKTISETPCQFEGKDIYVSVSVGSSSFRQADSESDIMEKADREMYRVKGTTIQQQD